MCDELIAGHGDCLPKLEAKTLVPTSGKSFKSVDPRDLRASWDAAAAKANEDSIASWKIIGPFKSPTPGKVSLELKTPVEDDFVRRADGGIDPNARYDASGAALKWKDVSADKKGRVDLAAEIGQEEWAVAYAYAEIDSIHQREAVLTCGSDDGIRIWLNGKVVHTHEVGRGYRPGNDAVTVHLKAGKNRLFVKIDNYVGGWGFGVAVPKPNF
jgi:hypothetical protein